MVQQIPWNFKDWIIRFKEVDLPIGDLASDIAKDENFPTEDYFGEIWDYLSLNCRNDSDILETFSLAWSYYLASKDSSRPAPPLTSS